MKYQTLKSILFLILASFAFSNYGFAAESVRIADITVYSDTVVFDVVPGGFKNVIVTVSSGLSGFYLRKHIDDNEPSVTVRLPQLDDGSGVVDGKYHYQIRGLTNKDYNAPENNMNNNSGLGRENRLSAKPWKQMGIIIIKNGQLVDGFDY